MWGRAMLDVGARAARSPGRLPAAAGANDPRPPQVANVAPEEWLVGAGGDAECCRGGRADWLKS